MSNEKMLSIINEVGDAVCERDELIHCIALALLSRKNLFVLGDVGQAKSYAIDLFCKHIKDARQFSTLMNKQTDTEQLFGRLDLASLIPGHVPQSVLKADSIYSDMKSEFEIMMENLRNNPNDDGYIYAVKKQQEEISVYEKSLATAYGGRPEFITVGKIPESHICFLDELFKANEGILNSLLKALNERVYTNEGRELKIPVISFFSASNEIPNFNNPEEKILKALYDRFDLKVKTEYVSEKENRMKTLKQKQTQLEFNSGTEISVSELEMMQQEVRKVNIPDSINELMDAVLLELRKKDISVSDRTFFNFGSVVQAEAFLNGRDEVIPADMLVLKNYLWNKPEEQTVIADVLHRLCENPVGDRLNELMATAYDIRDNFNAETDKNRALIAFKAGLLKLYDKAIKIKDGLCDGDAAISSVDSFISTLEDISRNAFSQTSFTYVSLPELKEYQKLSA